MANLFEFEELNNKKGNCPVDKSEILRDNYLKMHDLKVKTLKELNGRLPVPGEFFAIWTMKSFNAFTFIPYLIHAKGKIDTIVLATYSINRRIVDSLIKKIDQGKINKVEILISDSIKFRMPKVHDHLNMMVNARDKINVVYGWNHSKITLVECGEHKYVIEGSGNWSENAQYEQYLFFNDERLYQFRLNNIKNGVNNRKL